MVFDLYLLKRPGAEKEYSAAEIERAKKKLNEMSEEEKNYVFKNFTDFHREKNST